MVVNYPYHYRDFSYGAAAALLSAGEQGRYWEMHDLLLEISPDLSKQEILAAAEKLDIDGEALRQDLESMRHKARIDADVALAKKLDFYNTPTFVINGRVVIGNRPYKYLKKIIDEELLSVGN